jgi:hypothetical protein
MPLLVLLRTCLVLQTLGCVPGAKAWWDTGHMLTAAIARQRLSASALSAAEKLITASASVQTSSPVPSTTLVSAAHWADDLKRHDWPDNSKMILSPSRLFVAFDSPHIGNQHYVDYPFEDDGGSCDADVWNEESNILTALLEHRTTLADGAADSWSRGVALRFILHLVGVRSCLPTYVVRSNTACETDGRPAPATALHCAMYTFHSTRRRWWQLFCPADCRWKFVRRTQQPTLNVGLNGRAVHSFHR